MGKKKSVNETHEKAIEVVLFELFFSKVNNVPLHCISQSDSTVVNYGARDSSSNLRNYLPISTAARAYTAAT